MTLDATRSQPLPVPQHLPGLQPALQRLRRRRTQRGMAVFLVVLVMTTVTGIGLFSMHSASLVDRASGFHRQNVQTTGVVELGARAAATWLGPRKDEVKAAKGEGLAPKRVPSCNPALMAVSPEAECWVILSKQLTDEFADTAPATISDGLVGQLSSPLDSTAISAQVATEVTESFAGDVLPGSAGKLTEITFTTTSRLFPTDAVTPSLCVAANRGAVSQQRLRAQLLIQN